MSKEQGPADYSPSERTSNHVKHFSDTHHSSEDFDTISYARSPRQQPSPRLLSPLSSDESGSSLPGSIYTAVRLSSKENLSPALQWPNPWVDPQNTFITGGSRGSGLWTSAVSSPQEDPSTKPEAAALSPSTVHIPTPLDPIKEQRSSNTLRPSPTPPKQKHSFSLDDLPHSAHNKSSSSSTSAIATSFLKHHRHQQPPTQPLAPAHPPPFRVPTPPNIPTFNTPAATTYRLPAPRRHLRDLLHRSPRREWHAMTIDLPSGAIMRSSDGVLVQGKWRPTASAHIGWAISNTSSTPRDRGHATHDTSNAFEKARRDAAPSRKTALRSHPWHAPDIPLAPFRSARRVGFTPSTMGGLAQSESPAASEVEAEGAASEASRRAGAPKRSVGMRMSGALNERNRRHETRATAAAAARGESVNLKKEKNAWKRLQIELRRWSCMTEAEEGSVGPRVVMGSVEQGSETTRIRMGLGG